MSDLEEMSKQELLDHARELGVTPANNDMSKAELREGIEAYQAGAPTMAELPEQQVTTTSTKDWLNRALFNPVPGTSNATDYMGRSVVTGNKDYLGRNLVP